MEASPSYLFLREKDPFGFISPAEFEELGIDPEDIPLGTLPALRHPARIPSRFGGDAYGFGITEGYERLTKEELGLLLSIDLRNENSIKKHYKKLNEIYKKLGLLIRFSKKGKPYYLIPLHFVSSSLTDIKVKVDQIVGFIKEYRKQRTKESYNIGIFLRPTDLIFQELSYIFLEHNFIPVDSIAKLKDIKQNLDLFIITDDIYEIIRREKSRLKEYANYVMTKIYKSLVPEGELFVISERYFPDRCRLIKVKFKTEDEEKRFALFTHLFKTKHKYRFNRNPVYITEFEFYSYLRGIYVEPELVNKLLKGKDISSLSLEEINDLPYLEFSLPRKYVTKDQKKVWIELFDRYLEKKNFCAITPEALKKEWEKRFEFYDYEPEYMLVYQGKKKALPFSLSVITKDILESRIYGASPELMPDYRNSFEYVLKVIEAVKRLKEDVKAYENIPKIFMDRLRTPLYYKNRRHKGIKAVLSLVKRKNKIAELIHYFNPEQIEGVNTKLIENLELLGLFGFNIELLKELFLTSLGHGPIRRIIAGKINEASLKPVIDAANKYGIRTALNFLRYFRLMSFAEMEASTGRTVETEEVRELFRIYDLMVRAVISKDVDWQAVVYEGADSIEGLRRKVIKRVLMMMGYHRFLNNWQEIKEKGEKELEALADYDPENLKDIYNMRTLIDIMNQFEDIYLKSDPLQITTFYRKILRSDLHGTARVFRKMSSKNVFLLLWITINSSPADIINFNPLLEEIAQEQTDEFVKKIDLETSHINLNHLDSKGIRNLSEQLNKNRFTIIVGTGLYLKLETEKKILAVGYMDLDNNIKVLNAFYSSFSKSPKIHRISNEGLRELEKRFSEVELFYQAHKGILHFMEERLLPLRHKNWVKEVEKIREELRKVFLKNMFQPDSFYTNLEALYNYAPSVLNFLFPFFKTLQQMNLSWHIYMRLSPLKYILNTTKKLYALIRHEKEEFQDKEFLHKLAKKEFGLMATGTVGVSDAQLSSLINMLESLRNKKPVLFNALIKAFFFQEIGRVPYLREKYKGRFNPADLGDAGAVFIRQENMKKLYLIEAEEEEYLVFLVKYHSMLHHMIRGEFSFFAIKEILDRRDQQLFDAFFIFSFIMLSAIREDLLLEDLAGRLFKIKQICDRIIAQDMTLMGYMNKLFSKRGALYLQVKEYLEKGLANDEDKISENTHGNLISMGRMIYALERILRLRGIRYVEFPELAKLLMDKPINLIYRQKGFLSIGYSTFEKEMFEAYRIYRTFQSLPEYIRHYILNWLVDDKVRLFGYENVTNYMGYENQIKLLLLCLISAETFDLSRSPVSINFLDMCQIIDKRYEAINNYLNGLSIEKIWGYREDPYSLFSEKEGIFFVKEEFPNVLTVRFKEELNIQEKIALIKEIKEMERLRNYYEKLLNELNSYPFYSDDYKIMLKEAFEKRAKELFEEIVTKAKEKMDQAKDFHQLYLALKDIIKRSESEQIPEEIKNRIIDVYELRRDTLKREKISEIDQRLAELKSLSELNSYWNDIKLYLKQNRQYIGREFELLIAKKFDLKERELLAENVC